MKRILILAALLAACGHNNSMPVTKAPEDVIYASDWAIMVHSDPETGCQYLRLVSSGRELTPRIAADGKTHMGCKGGQP